MDNGKWSVIGITSFGVECGDSQYPGVYTRVDQYLDWIASTTQQTDTRVTFGGGSRGSQLGGSRGSGIKA